MDDKRLLENLGTEQVNERSARLDELDALGVARLMNEASLEAVRAVDAALPALSEAIEAILARMKKGGRLIYTGAGTSGRLGVLDASECPPTFGVTPDLVVGLIAGGDGALRKAVEGAEDDEALGAKDLRALGLKPEDSVVAISASGFAPYCVGALDFAREEGALAVALTCNVGARLSERADIAVEAPTGAEVLSGSTRLKAGTATKLMLNTISTACMVGLGKTYKNLMVDLRATNTKLRDRAIRLTMKATGLERAEAEALYVSAGGDIKVAIVMNATGALADEAVRALAEEGGFAKAAIARLAR